jgi:hypothetical protein
VRVRLRLRLRACGSGTEAQSLIAWLHLGGWDDDVLPWLLAEGLGTWESHDDVILELESCFRFDYYYS